MGTDQYHEPPEELSPQTRTFARMCANLKEEAEAIGWYEQRISIEPDATSRAIMTNSLTEEFKHFSMELEFLLRATPVWREIARNILFQDGDIVANGEAAEDAVAASAAGGTTPATHAEHPSLEIGSLRDSARGVKASRSSRSKEASS